MIEATDEMLYGERCTHEQISPSGNPKSNILLIGEFPGDEEIEEGKPFVGKAGVVLNREFAYNKVDIQQFRITNLWLHPIPKLTGLKKEDKIRQQSENEACEQYFIEQVINEAQGKDAVLLIGSTTVKTLCNRSVSAWNGLEIECDYFEAPIIMAMTNPAQVFHTPLGEVRLSIRKFCNKIKKRGYYE